MLGSVSRERECRRCRENFDWFQQSCGMDDSLYALSGGPAVGDGGLESLGRRFTERGNEAMIGRRSLVTAHRWP